MQNIALQNKFSILEKELNFAIKRLSNNFEKTRNYLLNRINDWHYDGKKFTDKQSYKTFITQLILLSENNDECIKFVFDNFIIFKNHDFNDKLLLDEFKNIIDEYKLQETEEFLYLHFLENKLIIKQNKKLSYSELQEQYNLLMIKLIRKYDKQYIGIEEMYLHN